MKRKIFNRTRILIFAGLLCWVQGCTPPPHPGAEKHPVNVLLVVVDTLRADRLGCLGNHAGLTPGMDRTAAGGVRFTRASAHSPWTLPSIASLLTSRHPSQHRAGEKLGDFRFSTLSESIPTLQQCFFGAGYRTSAVINVDFLSAAFGMAGGFDDVDFAASRTNNKTRDAAGTTDAALGQIEAAAGKPFFILVHYFDPHLEYDPPETFRRRHALPGDRAPGGHLFGSKPEMTALRNGRIKLAPAMLRRLEALYDGEVAYTDREIGRLLDSLSGLGLEASTLVVITADHGEEFGDHQGFEHGHTLYQELLHVPLIMRLPGVLPEDRAVNSTVRLIDLAPTILELAGLKAVGSFTGKSLIPLIEGVEAGDRPVFAEGNFWGPDLYSWQSGGFKLILRPGEGQEPSSAVELYDLGRDPGEQRELAGLWAGRRDEMLSDLKWIRNRGDTGEEPAAPGSVELDEEQVRRLEALGYLE